MSGNERQEKESNMNKGTKVLNLIDFLALWGACIAYVTLPPHLFVFSSFVFMTYYLFRFFLENSKWKKWAFLIIAIVCGLLGIYTLYDQSTLALIKVTLSNSGKQYFTDDEVYESDFSVTAVKKNGRELPVEVFEVEPTTLKKGKNILTVSYKGLEANITINAIDPYIEQLEVVSIKEKYFVGDRITKKDFNVIGIDSKGNRSIVTNYDVTPTEIVSEGDNRISFIYESVKVETVIHAFKHEITKIEAEYTGKESLFVGDSIDFSNIKVVGIYDNDVKEQLKDFSVKNPKLAKVGDNILAIEYKGLTTNLTVVAHGIVSIEAICTNMLLFEGDTITENDFTVYGVYDTGEKEEVVEFKYSIIRDKKDDVDDNTLVKGENIIKIQYENLSTELSINANGFPTGNVTLDDTFASFSMDDWNPALDFDINGQRHERGGKKITISNMFHDIDPKYMGTSNIKATWFVPLTPSKTGAESTFQGVFVLDYSAKQSGSTVTISVKAGENEYTFGPLDSQPVPFNINTENIDSMEIIFDCTVNGEGLVFGMLNNSIGDN